jgi:hypothetical protein
MTDLENKYKSLLEKIEGLKDEIKKVTDDIANIKKDNYIAHCGKIIPFKDIDPLSVEEKQISTYDDYEYEFYIPCNCPIGVKTCSWCSKKICVPWNVFNKILEIHGLNYYDIRFKLKKYYG